MTKLNDPVCATVGNNTGNPTCKIMPKNIVGGILVPKTTAISSANCATSALFVAAMQALTLNPPATRAYPFGPFIEMNDKSEEPVFVTTNYGVKQFVREGKIGWQFGLDDGGIKLQNALRSFNNAKNLALYFYDAENTVYGVDDGAGGMKGFSIDQFYANPWKAGDGTNPAKFLVDISFNKTRELNEDIVFLKLDVDPAVNIVGLLDVELVLVSQTSTKAVIKVQTASSKVNLFAQYNGDLDALAVWLCTKAGAAVTPTTLTAVAETEAFEFTLTTPTGEHLFNLVSPALLEAGGIGGAPDNGYESTGALAVTFS